MSEKIQIAEVQITAIYKNYAFGVLLVEPQPKQGFVPKYLVDAFELAPEDLLQKFWCMFIEQEGYQNPTIIALDEDKYELQPPEEYKS